MLTNYVAAHHCVYFSAAEPASPPPAYCEAMPPTLGYPSRDTGPFSHSLVVTVLAID